MDGKIIKKLVVYTLWHLATGGRGVNILNIFFTKLILVLRLFNVNSTKTTKRKIHHVGQGGVKLKRRKISGTRPQAQIEF